MSEYEPYAYDGNTMLIERYLMLSSHACPESDYEIFNLEMSDTDRAAMTEAASGGHRFALHDELNREGFNAFRRGESPANKRISFYAGILSAKKTTALICVMVNKGKCKLWANGDCILVGQALTGTYVTAAFEKGLNTLLFELCASAPDASFSMQLMDYDFQMGNDFKALSNVAHIARIDPLTLVCDPCYRPSEHMYRLMFHKNGGGVERDYEIEIHDSNTGHVRTIAARMDEPVEIDLDELRALHPETIRHEWLGCRFREWNGNEILLEHSIFLNDFSGKTAEINERLASACREQPPEIYENIMGRIAHADEILRNRDQGSYSYAWDNREILERLESGSAAGDLRYTPGIHEFYVHSQLDDSYVRVASRVPDKYDRDKRYPAFFALSTWNDGGFCRSFPDDAIGEPCLCFDVTGRGFTAGSYIGEASTLEIMERIGRSYAIDDDRVYMLGQSNGGYAVWSMAQNHPRIPAAIYPQISFPQIDSVENAAHIPTYQVVSPKDHIFKGREGAVKHRLGKHGNYHETYFREMNHSNFWLYIAHKGILARMMEARRDKYPREIFFRTCRNRHLDSCWIRLHGIERGKRQAQVKAAIESERAIDVRARGADGLTVNIPPTIDKDSFAVSINGKVFSFENYESDRIHFAKRNGWRIADSVGMPDFRKGTGLLDIYLGSLRIILPYAADDQLVGMAEGFSKPSSNGVHPELFTAYPIYDPGSVPDHIFSHNLLLLEKSGYPNPYIRRLSGRMPVLCEAGGYSYNGVFTKGSYVAMQAMPSPFNGSRTFMVISSNSDKLLRKHILLRKVIIPTYLNGLHPLWNNEILLLEEEGYLAAYEAGDALAITEWGGKLR